MLPHEFLRNVHEYVAEQEVIGRMVLAAGYHSTEGGQQAIVVTDRFQLSYDVMRSVSADAHGLKAELFTASLQDQQDLEVRDITRDTSVRSDMSAVCTPYEQGESSMVNVPSVIGGGHLHFIGMLGVAQNGREMYS